MEELFAPLLVVRGDSCRRPCTSDLDFHPPATIAGLAKVIEQPDITWIAQPGPGGGGGGGGTRTPEPPRKAEITPPKPRVVEAPKPKPEPPKPLPQANYPSGHVGSQELPGARPLLLDPPSSQGAGTGGGGGTGTGTGVGSGTGWVTAPGFGGGTGGGAYREGNGVTSPRVISEVKPNYTGEAMRARIQGMVTMEAIVMPDGSVGNVQVITFARPPVRSR